MAVIESTFSSVPEPSEAQLRREVEHALARRWALSIEHTRDPHARDAGWDPWGGPILDAPDADAALDEVKACRAAFPERYVKLVAFEAARGGAAVRLALFVQRPRAGRGRDPVGPARAARGARRARAEGTQPERSAS